MNIEPNENICPTCGNQNLDTAIIENDTLKRKAACALANHLAYVLRIPNGKELILLLGSGIEHNNTQAIEYWVYGRIANINHWPLQESDSSNLICELEKELAETLSNNVF